MNLRALKLSRKSGLRAPVKVIAALTCITLAGSWLLSGLQIYAASTSAVDRGERVLIVIASTGGDRDQTLRVKQRILEDGSLKIILSFTATNITYSTAERGELDYRITFAGLRGASAQCGSSSDPLQRQEFGDLLPSTQYALRLDALGGSASALNYRGKLNNGLEQRLEAATFPEWQGRLHVLNELEADDYDDRSVTDNGRLVWAEECILRLESVWRYGGDSFRSADRKTLLMPQINWTSITDVTDFQKVLVSNVLIDRSSEMELTESYPLFEGTDWGWQYDSTTFEAGAPGQSGNVKYTDLPVAIFTNRGREERMALFLLWAGVVVGVVATMVLQMASKAYDGVWGLFANRYATTEVTDSSPIEPLKARSDAVPRGAASAVMVPDEEVDLLTSPETPDNSETTD